MTKNEITDIVLRLSFKIHSSLGSGLLETVYKECLFYELTREGLYVEKEKGLPVLYETLKLPIGYRMDLFVENSIVVEIKSVDAFTDSHIAQILTYLKFSESEVGLLLNFKMASLKNGIKRVRRFKNPLIESA